MQRIVIAGEEEDPTPPQLNLATTRKGEREEGRRNIIGEEGGQNDTAV